MPVLTANFLRPNVYIHSATSHSIISKYLANTSNVTYGMTDVYFYTCGSPKYFMGKRACTPEELSNVDVKIDCMFRVVNGKLYINVKTVRSIAFCDN